MSAEPDLGPIGRDVVRLAVIGDVHCEDETLAQLLAFTPTLDLDAVLCVGDIVDGHGDIERTVTLLREHRVICVAGNHERWLLTDEYRDLEHATTEIRETTRSWMASLPRTRHFSTPHGGAVLCHGVGEDDLAMLLPDTRGYGLQAIDTLRTLMLDPEVAFVLGGHTHEPMVRPFPGLTVVNAGTIHRDWTQAFFVVDFDALKVERYDLGEGAPTPGEIVDLPLPLPLR